MRASSGRSALNLMGDTSKRWVRDANCMVARTALLMVIMVCLRIMWLHEQPRSSCMSRSEYMQWVRLMPTTKLQDVSQWTEGFTNMGAFGHALKKPTELIGSEMFLPANLYRKIDKNDPRFDNSHAIVHLPADSVTGKKRVTGLPAGLKPSQVYPPAYAENVFKEWYIFRSINQGYLTEMDDDELLEHGVGWDIYSTARCACDWKDSRLHGLVALLNRPMGKPL